MDLTAPLAKDKHIQALIVPLVASGQPQQEPGEGAEDEEGPHRAQSQHDKP